MRTFKRIAIFCGSSDRCDAVYREAARAVGQGLAERGIGVVYGGGRVGLMGDVADAALAAGGQVFGVIPEKLRALEVGHDHLTELFVVDSMHARKAMMAHLADAFIALPGGYGTLDEMFEAVTWTQLNYHLKPVGVLNVGGYYDGLLAFVRQAVAHGFVRDIHAGLISAAADLPALLDRLATAEIPEVGRWIEKP
jgi:uncharacterized protein (TIGR00730 family)